MSRMFGSKAADADGHEDQLPLLSELAPEVEALADRLAALPLPRLAAEVMTNAFKPEYEPGLGVTELEAILDTFLPPHGEFTGAIYKRPSPSAAEYSIRDLVREAAQLLEHAGLLIPKHYESNGNWTVLGWGTTRLGRAALTDGSVERRVGASAPSA
jgi:hypothetical protein